MANPPNPTFAPVPGMFPGGCVVLVGPDQAEPVALVKALTSRGLSVRVERDEPGVMAVFAERAVGRRVLVVVEPGQWARLAELMCAVNTFHREVLCWQYTERGEAQAKLTTLDQQFSGPGPNPCMDARSATGTDEQGPIGRIMTRRRAVDALLTRVPGRPLSSREIVTQQELTMLLGPVPGEAG